MVAGKRKVWGVSQRLMERQLREPYNHTRIEHLKNNMMQRFNLALLPVDGEKFQPLFSSIAQKYFSECADDYILGDGALAHITLCQFDAHSELDARSYFKKWAWGDQLSLSLDSFNRRTGSGEHSGRYWVEFLIQKCDALIILQKQCAAQLAHHSVQNLTPVDGYSPHITLARIDKAFDGIVEVPFKAPILFRLALGYSTGNGLFQREIVVD